MQQRLELAERPPVGEDLQDEPQRLGSVLEDGGVMR
jgi:hypothetical protein